MWLLVALRIQTADDCPGALEVERHLGPLLGEEAAVHDVATIARAGDGSVSLSTNTEARPRALFERPTARRPVS